jgi:hypothetical protein
MKAKLINEKLPFEIVEFDFNPESLTYLRESQATNRPGASQSSPGATPSILLGSPPKTLRGDGWLIGDDVQGRVDTLYSWMDPGGGLIGALVGAAVSAISGGRVNLSAKQPTLIFQWGTQLMRCVMKTMSVMHERFSPSGEPERSKVTFTVKEEVNIFGMLPTNPSSGGLPGRQRHVVSGSENVHTIANGAYGNPRLWRDVADANGVDDPFRVRPGDTIYLPNANEIMARR